MVYFYNRVYIKHWIVFSEKTKDGHYYCLSAPYLIECLIENNNIENVNKGESKYYYDRKYFYNKRIFTEIELNAFMSKKEIEDFRVDDMMYINNILNNKIDFNKFDSIKKAIDKYNKLEDLIDIIIFKYK